MGEVALTKDCAAETPATVMFKAVLVWPVRPVLAAFRV